MATQTTTAQMTNASQAQFQAWTQFIHNALVAFGWIQTADTGQINLSTVAAPTATNQVMGYEIWRMNDALQSTAPIFLKIEYGSGSAIASPSYWLTIGTGSNGAGTLTGNTTTRKQIFSNTASTTSTSYASGDTNRCVFAFSTAAGETQTAGSIFGIERTKNADGTDNTDGAFLFALHSSATVAHLQLLLSTGAQPAAESNFLAGLQSGTTMVFGANTYSYPIFPFGFYPRNPQMNAVIVFSADYTREITFTLDIYGANHTYLMIGNPNNSGGAGSAISALDRTGNTNLTRVAIRYE